MMLVDLRRVQMDSDRGVALAFFDRSLKQCEKAGVNEGVLQAKQAIRRLGRTQETKTL